MTYDLVIHNGTLVTVNRRFDIIPNGLLCIKDGKLERLETIAANQSLPAASETIDAGGGLIMPGLVNSHTHLPMTLFRGLADDLPLDSWLNEHIFPAEGAHIRPDSVRWATLLACAEMLLSGTTTCCDGYFFEDQVAEAVDISGMRAVLAQGVIDFPAPGVPDPKDNMKIPRAFVASWQQASALITPSVFCHSAYTCSGETLQKAKALSREAGLRFQIHAAETQAEVRQIRQKYKTTPIGYLDRLGILDENTLLVHCVWIDEADIDRIANQKASISHNPESNAKLAAGIAPAPQLLKAGIALGLGTDGCASNNNLDLFHEMDMAAKIHKAQTYDPTTMDARTVVEMATIGSARAIGLGDQIGSLDKGKQADVIIIEKRSPHLTPMYHPASHIVYAAKSADVRDVIVAGRVLVRNRQILTLDVEHIMSTVNSIADQIKKEL
ncbi:MAG: amidohydrolase [Deltaproteobacteria bacterium]|jgi:5-methylthioadenosine/S-adenosylhomocysteine deaminase|nr:amidohydrolase [Deltaproteobacteria bacterium]MBW2469594.1 amidohydrolase [Deltaproteobacteria bacterium]MBW2487219.1 amidohydrolase [Deltaproteobacteria bacterium]MBW2518523.1 amidohydrolase [Deltaproteobacteria bacterium]